MITLVKRGTDEIVHAGIDDDEFLLRGLLKVTNARQQDAGVADEKTARLKQHAQAERAQRRHDRGRVIARS